MTLGFRKMTEPTPEQRAEVTKEHRSRAYDIWYPNRYEPSKVMDALAALIAERDAARAEVIFAQELVERAAKDVVKLRGELGCWFPIVAAVASAAGEPNGILIKPDLCKHAEALLREMGR